MSVQLPPHELELMELFNRDISQAERNRLIELLSAYPELSEKYAFYLHLQDLELAEMPEPDPVIHARLMKMAAKESRKVKLGLRFDVLLHWLTQPMVSGPAVLCLVFLVGYELMESNRPAEERLIQAQIESEAEPSAQSPEEQLDSVRIPDLDKPARDQVTKRRGADALTKMSDTAADTKPAVQPSKRTLSESDDAFDPPSGDKNGMEKGTSATSNKMAMAKGAGGLSGSATSKTIRSKHTNLIAANRGDVTRRGRKQAPAGRASTRRGDDERSTLANRESKRDEVTSPIKKTFVLDNEPESNEKLVGETKASPPEMARPLEAPLEDAEGSLDTSGIIGEAQGAFGTGGSGMIGSGSKAGGLSRSASGSTGELDRSKREAPSARPPQMKRSTSREATRPKRKRIIGKVTAPSDSDEIASGLLLDDESESDVVLALAPAAPLAPTPTNSPDRAPTNAAADIATPDTEVQSGSAQVNRPPDTQQQPKSKTVNASADVRLTEQESSRLRRAKDDLNFSRSKSDKILGLARLALRANDLEQAATWAQWVIKRNDKHLRDALELRRQIQARLKRP